MLVKTEFLSTLFLKLASLPDSMAVFFPSFFGEKFPHEFLMGKISPDFRWGRISPHSISEKEKFRHFMITSRSIPKSIKNVTKVMKLLPSGPAGLNKVETNFFQNSLPCTSTKHCKNTIISIYK